MHSWNNIQDWFIEAMLHKQHQDSPGGGGVIPKKSPKIDYQTVLVNASRSMIRFKKPERLIKIIVKLIDEQLGVTHTAVLLHREKKGAYILIDSKGMEGVKIPVGYIRLNKENPIINIFNDRRNPITKETGALSFENVNEALKDNKLLKKEKGLKDKLLAVKEEMERLRANICVPSFFKRELLGVLILGKKLSGQPFTQEEVDIFLALANDTSMAISNARLIENLKDKVKEIEFLYKKEKQLFINTTIALAAAVDARDPYTHGHTQRVTHFCMAISNELSEKKKTFHNLNFDETLQIAALLHDIGKIGIPDMILNKDGVLTPEEYEAIKEHPTIGANILHPIRELRDVIESVEAHQEWYDGSGYPKGLKGEEIPLAARVIAVADAFDAITTDRPYKKKRSIEKAVEEIKVNAGTQFDPQIVYAFLRAYKNGNLFSNGNSGRAR
jgi:putative nucleotidyltransferase with HDIG domain